MRWIAGFVDAAMRSARVQFVVAIVIFAVALTGRLSSLASYLLLLVAFGLSAFRLRTRPKREAIPLSFVIACFLVLVAIWVRPERTPAYSGKLEANSVRLAAPGQLDGGFEIGDSNVKFRWLPGSRAGEHGEPIFVFYGSSLILEMVDGRLMVSTNIRDRDGDLVAEIVRNEWKVAPPPKTWDRNYSDNALEIRDPTGRIVLQVQLYLDRVRIQGEWRGPDGNGIRMVKCRNAMGNWDGCFVHVSRGSEPDEPAIEPIFVYPSETHFGARVK